MKALITRIINISKNVSKKFRDDNISEYSAYSALFIFLSFLPFAALLTGIVGSLGLSENIRFSGFYILSDGVTRLLRQLLKEAEQNKISLISVGAVTSIWSSARGLTGIINGLNSIHGVSVGHGNIITRIKAVFYTLIFAAIIIATLLLLVFGQLIVGKLSELLDGTELLIINAFAVRWVAAFAALIVFFLFIFAATPKRKGSIRSKIPGAFFSAAGWIVFSAAYSLYVRHFADHSVLYGSLTVIVLLILWLYFCMYILFIGEELNIYLETHNKEMQ